VCMCVCVCVGGGGSVLASTRATDDSITHPQVGFLVDHSKSAWITGVVYAADGGALATGL
jgi:hypothetical protein